MSSGRSQHLTESELCKAFFAQTGGCGYSLWVVTADCPDPVEYRFIRPFMIIGSSSQCDVRLQHVEVSFRHAYLQWVDGRVGCFDLASRTGTERKSETDAKVWLKSGEWFRIGPYFLKVDTARDTDAALSRPGMPVEARLEVIFPEPETEKDRWQKLNRRVILAGWGESCHLRLKHPSVSQVHVSMICTEYGVWVVNLLGRTAPYINGRPVRFHFAAHDDELSIGPFRFRVDYRNRPRRLAAPKETAPATKQASREVILPPTGIARVKKPGPPPKLVEGQIAKKPPATTELTTEVRPTRKRPNNPPPQDRDARRKPRDANPVRESFTTISESYRGEGSDFETFVSSLVGQFAQMQQEMFNQNQQMMQMMATMFDSVHREQRDFVQNEFRTIQSLTDELQQVRDQIVNEAKSKETLAESETSVAPMIEESAQVVKENSEARPRSEPKASPANTAADEPASETRTAPSPSGKAESEPPVATTAQETADRHLWLTQRLQKLERERNSRWRKLMRILKGGKSGSGA